MISTLAHPLFYVLLAYDAVYGGFLRQAESLLGLHFWAIATFNLIAGYGAAIVLGWCRCARAGWPACCRRSC